MLSHRACLSLFTTVACVLSITLLLAADTPSLPTAGGAAPTLEDLAFLTGDWALEDEVNGERRYLEERWSDVVGNSLLCTVRWLDANDQIRIAELITVTEQAEQIEMHVRQLYGPAMTVSERCPEAIRLVLTALDESSVTFTQTEGQQPWVHTITWERSSAETLKATIQLRPGDDASKWLNFLFHRR